MTTAYTSQNIPTGTRHARIAPVRLIVVHVNVGPEVEGGAVSLARYTQHEQGGYHEIVDDHVAVVTAADNETVNGAGGVNAIAWHICLVGEPNQSAQQWADGYSLAELDIAAQRVALACKRFGVTPQKVNGPQLAAGAHGVCGHKDVSDVYAASQGHWDPGPAFPWDSFLNAVVRYLHPARPITNTGDDEDVRYAIWIPDGPIPAGDWQGKTPTILVTEAPIYGDPVEATQLSTEQEKMLVRRGVPTSLQPALKFVNLVIRPYAGAGKRPG